MRIKLLEYRDIALRVFIMLLIVYIAIYIYKLKNPLAFPGIEGRFIFTLAITGVITILLHLPYEKLPLIKHKVSEEIKDRIRIEYFKKSIETLFSSLLTLYLLLLLVQQIFPKIFELIPINLNYLLFAVVIFGVIHVLLHRDEEHEETRAEKITKKDYAFIGAMSILGGVIIWYKTRNIGWLSYLISIIGGVLIFLLSVIVLEGDKDECGGCS